MCKELYGYHSTLLNLQPELRRDPGVPVAQRINVITSSSMSNVSLTSDVIRANPMIAKYHPSSQ